MDEIQFQETLKTRAQELLNEGRSVEEVQSWVDGQKSRWAEHNAGKTQEPQVEDAAAVPEDGASILEDTSLVSQEEEVAEHNARAAAIKTAQKGVVGGIPDFLLEPLNSFVGTLVGIGAGAIKFIEQDAYREAQKRERIHGESETDIFGLEVTDVKTDEQLQAMTPAERLEEFEKFSSASDDIQAVSDMFNDGVERTPGSSGSIFTEISKGNYGEAANLTANQSAAGLASLVPFLVPGGAVLGPSLLGGSAKAGAFEEGLAREDATMNQIRLASYAQGGNEFVWEFVTAGLVGKAKKMLGGGASKEAVDKFVKTSLQRITGAAKSEGFSEGITDTGSQIIDNLIYGDGLKAKELITGFADAALIGSIIGGKVATFGELGANGSAQQAVAANALKTPEQKTQDQSDAKVVGEAAGIVTEYQKQEEAGQELSLVDQAKKKAAEQTISEKVEEIKARDKKHIDTLNDMTQSEQQEYASNLDQANKLEEAKKKATVESDIEILDNAIQEAREKAFTAYNTVANWQETTRDIDATIENNENKKKEIEQEEGNIQLEEKAAAQAEKPNPVGTRKRKQRAEKLVEQKKKVEENISKLKDVKAKARPTHADAKHSKKKKKREQLPEIRRVVKKAEKAVVTAEQRTERNAEINEILADKSVPAGQKSKYITEAIKLNKGLVISEANKALRKLTNFDGKPLVGRNEFISTVEAHVYEAVEADGTFDLNTISKATKRAEREAKNELGIRRKEAVKITPEVQEEIDYAKGLLDDGVINQAEYQDMVEEAKGEQKIVQTDLFTEVDGVVQEKKEVAEYGQGEDLGGLQEDLIKILSETPINELAENYNKHTEKIFKLLPNSVKVKAFDGLLADGNIPVEAWTAYFGGSGNTAVKRRSRLRDQLEKAQDKLFGIASLDESTGSDITDGAFEFLEGKAKPSVKSFLPLLAKLKRSFPDSKIIISKAKMMELFIESGMDPGRVDNIKGMTDGNNVYLNPEKLDAETPIHEFGHIWAQTTRQERPDLYAKGAELIKESKEWKKLEEKVKNKDSVYFGMEPEAMVEEAIATAIGLKGQDIFEQKEDQSQWDKLKGQIWDWIGSKLGIKKVEDLTLDQFVTLAATEIVTGEKFITPELQAEVDNSLIYNYLQVPVGSTRTYTPSKKPVAEIDTHGVFNGKKLKQEALNTINKYYDEIQNGGWIGYTTGTYGNAVVGTEKFDAKKNAKVEAKVKTLQETFKEEGLEFVRDPRNDGFHIVRKPLKFLEDTPKAEADKTAKKAALNAVNKKIRKALQAPKSNSAYKHSKISQEVREILNWTKRDLAKRGDTLTNQELNALDAIVTEKIQEGKDYQKGVRKFKKDVKESTQADVNQIVDNSESDAPNYKDRDKFLNRVKRVKLSSLLAPASNNDFEGLLYRLLPKGKARLSVQRFIESKLLDPLAKANANYLGHKDALRNQWEANKEALTDHNLNDDSGIILETAEGTHKLTKGEVVKAYNYAKDPNLYPQMERGGIDIAKINEIVDYVNNNEQLRTYANGVTEVYQSIAPAINEKLNEHGRKTFTAPKIDADLLSPEQIEIMHKLYGGVPAHAVYTPVTAEGADSSVDIDSLLEAGNFNNYTVMDGRLKEKTGGGEIKVAGKNPDSEFENYLRGPVRSLAFMDFAQNASDFFGPNQLKAMKLKYGDAWSASIKDSLRRIVSGKNEPAKSTDATNFIERTLQRQVGSVMFFNVRSALLQHLSYFNFYAEDFNAMREGGSPTQQEKLLVAEAMRPYLGDRGKGRTDVVLEQLFGRDSRNWFDVMIEKGYDLTKWGDKNAIAWGGSKYMVGKMRQYKKEGLTDAEAVAEAYKDFIRVTEATQQSTLPERLGREQTTKMGRYLLAFANTPQQYNRKISRAIQDLKGLKGVNTEEAAARKKKAIGEIVWYLGAQNAIFTSLQSLSFAALGLDAGDDDEVRATNWVNSMVNTILRGAGAYGAITAAAKDAIIAVSRDKDVADSIVGAVPSLGTLIRNLRTAAGQKPIYPNSELMDSIDPEVAKLIYQTSAGISAVGGPGNKALKLMEQIADVISSDLSVMERLARASGYGRYQIDENLGGPLKRLARGEAGQAHKDGTIEVDPNLSPEEKKKTIAHEEKHVKDMEAGKLDYTDTTLTYNGTTYPRKDGKIQYDGKWIKEGSKEFPWEQVAYNAESPLNQNHPDEDDHKVDKSLQEHDEKADKFTKDWFNDPETRKRLKGQAGLTDEQIDERINHATTVETRVNNFLEAGDAETHDRGTFFGEVIPEGEEGYFPGRIDVGVDPSERQHAGILEHEQAHALGFDNILGYKAQKILGKAKHSSYLNNPAEVYGNLQEFRNIVGLKAHERSLTPEQLQEKIMQSGAADQSDVQEMLRNFDIEKLAKTLNTIAEADNSKEGRFNNLKKFYSGGNSAVARLKSKYS